MFWQRVFWRYARSRTEENLVVVEWQSGACGAPWRRRPVPSSARYTAVPSHVNTWTPVDTACRWRVVGRPASVDHRAEIASDDGRWWLARWHSWPAAVCRSRFTARLRTVSCRSLCDWLRTRELITLCECVFSHREGSKYIRTFLWCFGLRLTIICLFNISASEMEAAEYSEMMRCNEYREKTSIT